MPRARLDASSRSRSELAGALRDAAGLPRGRDTILPIFGSSLWKSRWHWSAG
jgi:hypothetical protein